MGFGKLSRQLSGFEGMHSIAERICKAHPKPADVPAEGVWHSFTGKEVGIRVNGNHATFLIDRSLKKRGLQILETDSSQYNPDMRTGVVRIRIGPMG